MYVYKCNLCKRIFKSSFPLKSLKCTLCGGNLAPFATADIVHPFQHPQEAKDLFFSPKKEPERSDTSPQEIIQEIIRTIEAKKATEDTSKMSSLRQVDSISRLLDDIICEIKNTSCQTTKTAYDDPRALQWRKILSSRLPRILILGAQGTGKSCLAFWLLEILQGRCSCFVYRLPEEGVSLIPSWLGVIQDLNDAPPTSLILIDEAYLVLFSRESWARKNRDVVKILNLARQKRLGFIFVAHEARHIDKNILSCIDTLIMKRPSPLQVELDRSFLRGYLLKAQKAFEGKSDSFSKSISYICFSPSGFEGTLENPKPSFWSEKLSHIFATGNYDKIEKTCSKTYN